MKHVTRATEIGIRPNPAVCGTSTLVTAKGWGELMKSLKESYKFSFGNWIIMIAGLNFGLIPIMMKHDGFYISSIGNFFFSTLGLITIGFGVFPLIQRILAKAFGLPKLWDDLKTITAARDEYHRGYADASNGIRAILTEMGSSPMTSLRNVDQVRRELERLELHEETNWEIPEVLSTDERVQLIRERAAASKATAAKRKAEQRMQ